MLYLAKILLIAKGFAESLGSLGPLKALLFRGHKLRSTCLSESSGHLVEKAKQRVIVGAQTSKKPRKILQISARFTEIGLKNWAKFVPSIRHSKDRLFRDVELVFIVKGFFAENSFVAYAFSAREFLVRAISRTRFWDNTKNLAV